MARVLRVRYNSDFGLRSNSECRNKTLSASEKTRSFFVFATLAAFKYFAHKWYFCSVTEESKSCQNTNKLENATNMSEVCPRKFGVKLCNWAFLKSASRPLKVWQTKSRDCANGLSADIKAK